MGKSAGVIDSDKISMAYRKDCTRAEDEALRFLCNVHMPVINIPSLREMPLTKFKRRLGKCDGKVRESDIVLVAATDFVAAALSCPELFHWNTEDSSSHTQVSVLLAELARRWLMTLTLARDGQRRCLLAALLESSLRALPSHRAAHFLEARLAAAAAGPAPAAGWRRLAPGNTLLAFFPKVADPEVEWVATVPQSPAQPEQPTNHGLPLVEATNQGLLLAEATNHGLPLVEATNHGLPLVEATNHGLLLAEATNHGLPLVNATNQGLPLVEATNQGLPLVEATNHGMPLVEATNHGLPLVNATNHGLPLVNATNHGLPLVNATNHGLPLVNATNHGLPLVNATNQGLPLVEATNQGLPLVEATNHGMPLVEATNHGLPLVNATNHGLPLVNATNQGLPLVEATNHGLPAGKGNALLAMMKAAKENQRKRAAVSSHGLVKLARKRL